MRRFTFLRFFLGAATRGCPLYARYSLHNTQCPASVQLTKTSTVLQAEDILIPEGWNNCSLARLTVSPLHPTRVDLPAVALGRC